MPLTNTELADYIDQVHEWLIEHGWGQEHAYDEQTGHYCVMGAINNVVGWAEGNTCVVFGPPQVYEQDPRVEARIEINRALCAALGPDELALAFWNDDPDRTEDEVLDLLRTAAKELRG